MNDAEELKATAFTLSQTDYADEIDFEEINIDQDVTFKEHQVSMRNLQEQTQLDLEDLFELDTFTGNEPAVAIENESWLVERIQVEVNMKKTLVYLNLLNVSLISGM